MQIFVPKECRSDETRVPLNPDAVGRLVKQDIEVVVESGVGASCHYADAAYEKAGATVTGDRQGALGQADVVLRIHQPPVDEIALMKQGAVHVSFLDPFHNRLNRYSQTLRL